MIRKTLFHCMLAGLFLVGLGMIGCSDDTQRIITGPTVDQLNTGTDWLESDDDGVIEGWDFNQDSEDVLANDQQDLEDRDADDITNRKPLDNGRN